MKLFRRGNDILTLTIKLTERNLCSVPGFMKNIHVKELKVGNNHINSAVRESAFLLDPE